MKKSWRAVALEAIVGGLLGFAMVRFVGRGFSWRSLPVGMTVSFGLWLAFSVYWSIAARNSKPTQTSESVGSRQLHVVLINGGLLLLLLPVPGLTRRFLPDSRVLVVVGLVIQTVFLLFAVWARRHLGRNWSGEVRIAAEHELVRSGPYKHIRHPIYTAILGMYVGTMLVSGEIHALIALAVVTLAYWRKIRMEERALNGVFGEAYEAYRRESWALVPPLL
jgi:protein-S-isoprenylcysteine O-methyltransferase Ste14